MVRVSKAFAVIEDAREASFAILADIPIARVKWRAQAELIVSICQELVGGKPAQEPTSILLAEIGRVRHVNFPAAQTMLNGYGGILKVWRKAYLQVISSASSNTRRGRMNFAAIENDIGSLDAGGVARMKLMSAMLKESQVENDRLRKLILASVPAPAVTPEPHNSLSSKTDLADILPLLAWLADIENGRGYLSAEPSGFVLRRRLTPGVVVVPAEVVEAVKRLATGMQQGQLRS